MPGPTLFQLSYLLLWILALALVVVAVVILYLIAQLQAGSRLAIPSQIDLVGQKVPTFSAKVLSSGGVSEVRDFRGEFHAILALSPNCGSCFRLIDDLKSCSGNELAKIPVLLLCMGDLERCRIATEGVHSIPVLVLDSTDGEAKELWQVGLPAALIVNETGQIIDVTHPSSVTSVVTAIQDAIMNMGGAAPENQLATMRQRAAIG